MVKMSVMRLCFLVIVMVAISSQVVGAESENDTLNVCQSSYEIYIDDVKIKFEGVSNLNVNDIEMIPVKFISNILNYDVVVNDSSVEIKNIEQGHHVKFFIGDDSIEYGYNGDSLTLKYPISNALSIKIDDEIYMSCYDYCLVMNLKFSEIDRGNFKYNFYTRNYLNTGRSLVWEHEEVQKVDKLDGSMIVFIDNGVLQISINNEIVSFKDLPFIDENGRTQVPVRELCEFLNKRVYWFENPQRVTISTVPADLDNTNSGGAGGDSIEFVIGENKYSKNGKEYPMDTVARIINNRTYIPLRVAGEFLNYEVIWQE